MLVLSYEVSSFFYKIDRTLIRQKICDYLSLIFLERNVIPHKMSKKERTSHFSRKKAQQQKMKSK